MVIKKYLLSVRVKHLFCFLFEHKEETLGATDWGEKKILEDTQNNIEWFTYNVG